MTESSDPQVSVLVACTRPELIEGILQALLSEADSASCELVVGGAVGGLCLSPTHLPVTLIECDPKQLNQTRLLMAERARGSVLAFLDDDAVPLPGWLAVAASLPADSTEIWTGPEIPTRSSPGAVLASQVGASILAEGYWGHIGVGDHPVRWYEVPFCNLVLRSELLDHVGLPDAKMVWDLDDFDFCRRAAAQGAGFRTRQGLSIRHDRYPDRISDWFIRKARDRYRTGSKLVRYPALYLKIPSVVVAAGLPWVGLVVLGVARRRQWQVVGIFGGAYFLAVAVEATSKERKGCSAGKFAAGLIALHVTSTAALQAGLAVGVAEKLLGLPDKNLPTQSSS